MIRLTFIRPDNSMFEAAGEAGDTLLKVAQGAGLEVEGACEGNMACSTCHMIIDKAWYGKLPEACHEEEEMLDLAPGLTSTSRLGCQVELTDDLDGMIVRLPKSTRNMMGF